MPLIQPKTFTVNVSRCLQFVKYTRGFLLQNNNKQSNPPPNQKTFPIMPPFPSPAPPPSSCAWPLEGLRPVCIPGASQKKGKSAGQPFGKRVVRGIYSDIFCLHPSCSVQLEFLQYRIPLGMTCHHLILWLKNPYILTYVFF